MGIRARPAVADSDLQISWGGGGSRRGHPDPEISGGGGGAVTINFFRPFGPQSCGLKIRGMGGGPLS